MSTDNTYLASYEGIVRSWKYDLLAYSEIAGDFAVALLYDAAQDKYAVVIINDPDMSTLEFNTPWGASLKPDHSDYPPDHEWATLRQLAADLHQHLCWGTAEEARTAVQKGLDAPNGSVWGEYDSQMRAMLLSQLLPLLAEASE